MEATAMEQTRKNNPTRSQGGFTLIEIIAVLVILGILAAVAVPRFMSLQADARVRALDGAFAAGASQLAMNYAQDVLRSGKQVPDGTGNSRNWDGGQDEDVTLGDFEATLRHRCGSGAGNAAFVRLTGGPAWFDDITEADFDAFFDDDDTYSWSADYPLRYVEICEAE